MTGIKFSNINMLFETIINNENLKNGINMGVIPVLASFWSRGKFMIKKYGVDGGTHAYVAFSREMWHVIVQFCWK